MALFNFIYESDILPDHSNPKLCRTLCVCFEFYSGDNKPAELWIIDPHNNEDIRMENLPRVDQHNIIGHINHVIRAETCGLADKWDALSDELYQQYKEEGK